VKGETVAIADKQGIIDKNLTQSNTVIENLCLQLKMAAIVFSPLF
jgi:hypothetical protein